MAPWLGFGLAVRRGLGSVAKSTQTPTTPAAAHAHALPNRMPGVRALRHANVEATIAAIQAIKLLAIGKATRWQGYEARLGLGITRTRNHTNEHSPVTEKSHTLQPAAASRPRTRPVTGQTR